MMSKDPGDVMSDPTHGRETARGLDRPPDGGCTTPRIALSVDRIAAFCSRWRVMELAVFGSVVRDDFGPDSDVDVLVKFDPGARRTLFDIVRMQDELSGMVGRNVDLTTRAAVEGSRNHIRRKAILETAQVVYAA